MDFRALKRESLVSVYAFTRPNCLSWCTEGLVLLLGERLTIHTAFGVLLVLAGLFLVAR